MRISITVNEDELPERFEQLFKIVSKEVWRRRAADRVYPFIGFASSAVRFDGRAAIRLGEPENIYSFRALLVLTRMYGPAVRCKRTLIETVDMRSCINVSGL